ncbi:MAG: HD domain-containing protein [Deltaproteobacteria bacterium]|nr:HD domain-containing protein [Deltaproteobacteria bacterium]
MKQKDLTYLKSWFADYVSGFYTDNPTNNSTIRLKEKHTESVCENMILLGKNLGLSDEEMVLTETMALFHDIGRFKQYAVYGTFKDVDSENHALLGLRELTAHNVLDICAKDERKWITKAIANHNAVTIPKNENGKSLFYIRLLRDADKLDIWRVFIDYYKTRDEQPNPVVEIGLSDDPSFSPQVLSAFSEERFVRFQDLRTLNDFKLLLLSWVFDLNFTFSIQMVKDRGYIEKIGAILPNSQETKKVLKHIHDYMERHLYLS